MRTIRAKCEAGILVLIVFVLGAIGGGLGYRLWAGPLPVVNGPAAEHGGVHTQRSPARLDLTSDQQKQLRTIMDDMSAHLRAVYGPSNTKADEIRTKTRAKIRAILTPDQQTKFDAMNR